MLSESLLSRATQTVRKNVILLAFSKEDLNEDVFFPYSHWGEFGSVVFNFYDLFLREYTFASSFFSLLFSNPFKIQLFAQCHAQ